MRATHTLRNFRSANFRSALTDNRSFEQWNEEGAKDMQLRAHAHWKRLPKEHESPHLGPAIDEALLAFVAEKKAATKDRWH